MATSATTDPANHWRLTPPDGGEPVVIDSVTEGQATFIPGKTVTYAGAFRQHANEERHGFLRRWERLRAFEEVAGAYAAELDGKSRPWYREQHGSDLTALVAVYPPAESAATGHVRGLWGLVDDIEDATNTEQTRRALSFSILYLADLDEFESARAVRNAFEV